MAIPLIGVPIVNGAHWLERLVSSIDFPVDDLFIVNNNGRGEIDSDLDKIKETGNEYVKDIHIIHLPRNIGCSAAWNLIIKCYMQKPYWVICNHDIAFTPGLLSEIYTKMLKDDVYKLGTGDGTGWDLFALKDVAVELVGLFDENFYPAYCEDVDYDVRMSKIKMPQTPIEHKHYHGPLLDSYDEGSRTWRDEPKIANQIHYNHHQNKAYVTAKWNENWQRHLDGETNRYPFNIERCPNDYMPYDLKFIKSKDLGF